MGERTFEKGLFNATQVGIRGGRDAVEGVAKLLGYPPSKLYKTHRLTKFPHKPVPQEYWDTPIDWVAGEVKIRKRMGGGEHTFISAPVLLTAPQTRFSGDEMISSGVVIDLRNSVKLLRVSPLYFDPSQDNTHAG